MDLVLADEAALPMNRDVHIFAVDLAMDDDLYHQYRMITFRSRWVVPGACQSAVRSDERTAIRDRSSWESCGGPSRKPRSSLGKSTTMRIAYMNTEEVNDALAEQVATATQIEFELPR